MALQPGLRVRIKATVKSRKLSDILYPVPCRAGVHKIQACLRDGYVLNNGWAVLDEMLEVADA